ncbi:MAG: efflux RND transporter periplasmic adaptor subunit [Acidobacteriota bacterium]|nr:efflux RND transporter periplasmic adaptor subunit [Acidobacteriota bacterium]
MKRIVRAGLLLLVVAAIAVFFYHRRHQQPAQTNLRTLSGNIEAHESLVSFRVQGRIVGLPVEEGQQVEAGTLLAQLEDGDYRQKVKIDEAGVQVHQSNLTLALAGTRQQEINAAQQAVVDARAEMAQRKLDSARAENLFAKDEGTAQERDQAATALKRAQATCEAAEQRYNEAVEGTRKEDIAIARANLNQAQQSLGLSRVTLGYTVLRAPNAGVITVRQAELGEVVSPGTPVVTVADLDHVWLRAYIAETDLARVHWGQEVTVTTDSFPGRKFRGRISFISSAAEFTPKSVQTYQERVTLVYRIKMDLDNPDHALKPGMPADAQIALADANGSSAGASAGK